MSNKTWSKQNEIKQTTLFNYLVKLYPTINKETFIVDMKQPLLNIIKEEQGWGESTKKGFYFMISRYLDIKTPEDEFNIKLYAQKGYDLKVKIDEKDKENKLDEKEQKNFKSKEYFLDILKNLKFNETKNKYQSHLKQLLLSFVILQPPMRTNFYTSAMFITNLKDNNEKNNYIFIDKCNNSANIIINTDKATNYKLYKTNKDLSFIAIENKVLNDLIIDSFTTYSRTFLFENEKTKQPYGDNALLDKLREITRLPTINFQMMRSNYITWEHKDKPAYIDKEKLSKKMRHSVSTASINYFKDIKENEEEEKEPTILNAVEVDTSKNNFNKARKDNLYKYNIKGSKPTEKTLLKYDIKFDEALKQYY